MVFGLSSCITVLVAFVVKTDVLEQPITCVLEKNLVHVCADVLEQPITCVLEENLVHVCAGVLEQLVVRVEDDNGNLAVAENA